MKPTKVPETSNGWGNWEYYTKIASKYWKNKCSIHNQTNREENIDLLIALKK